MTLVVEVPPGYARERRWVTEVILADFLGLRLRVETAEREDVRIALEGDRSGRALRMPDVLFATPRDRWLTERSLPAEPLPRWDVAADVPEAPGSRDPLPVLFRSSRHPGPWVRAAGDELLLDADIFGSAFFLLSRYEEMPPGPRDVHGRFSAGSSIAFREGFLERPVVNEYLDVLWGLLSRLWPRLRRKAWTYRLAVSHDVDHPSVVSGRALRGVARSVAGDMLKRRDPGLAVNRVRAYRDSRRGRFDRDPADTFDFLMDTSERHGRASAFYFICGRTGGDIDGNYSVRDPHIRQLIRRIHARGHEIGLHPSYGTFRAPEAIRHEFEALLATAEREGVQQSSWGARQHFLRWENPVTWQGYEDVGLDYDTSLGFADSPGFRCGVCYPYPAFNVRSGRALSLVERPLQAMDASHLVYLGLSLEESLRRIVDLAETVRGHRGEFVFAWHNSGLLTARQKRVYSRLIGALAGWSLALFNGGWLWECPPLAPLRGQHGPLAFTNALPPPGQWDRALAGGAPVRQGPQAASGWCGSDGPPGS